jgi:hypothetical protein
MKAVVTADIVNSTLVGTGDFTKLMDQIKEIFSGDKMEIYRGDSFQVLINDAESALLKCVQSRLIAMQYTGKKKVDIRMSIGLGNLQSKNEKVGSNMEDVFVRSGRYFDKFQNSQRRLYIVSGNESLDFTLEIIAEYIDTVLETITPKQAEVMGYLLSGKSQVETARQLNKTTATINQHVKTARYNEIDSMIGKFKILTNQL